jgi:hypothetical protein
VAEISRSLFGAAAIKAVTHVIQLAMAPCLMMRLPESLTVTLAG